MASVALTGAAGPLGRRVAALLAADPGVERLVIVDGARPDGVAPAAEIRGLDLLTSELQPAFDGADVVVHVAEGPGAEGSGPAGVAAGHDDDVRATRRVLDAAGVAGASTVVLLSSAAVYGAWPNNPVPLTEEAPVRPHPGLAFAVSKAEIERLAAAWRDDHPGSTVALLRPAVTLAEEDTGWMARAMRAEAGIRAGNAAPPAQFVHLDDVALAVDVARRQRLDGPHNVAPDGHLSADAVRALAGRPQVRLPEPVATRLAAWRWRLRLAPTPPALVAYTVHPWVVANDRLRAAGWEPANSNEEAYVAAHRPGRWATLSPRRRQELSLGVAAVGLAGIVTTVVALVRSRSCRLRRRAARATGSRSWGAKGQRRSPRMTVRWPARPSRR
ncbi:NAD-dependent epimerase/dehydratase family protein [soil metagenome]